MTENLRTATSRRRRLVASAAAATLLGGGLALGAATSASAAPAADGWTRVAHLSPDTKGVDVRLTALAGGDVLYELDDVGYGDVSPYLAMPTGTYVISMVPTGADPASTPVVSASIDVAAGQPLTVAAYGTNDALKTAVYSDDLTNPADGSARVRVIQASTVASSVDIATTTGLQVAEGATTGAATGYATVPAGPWTLDLSGDASGQADIALGSGTVNSLLVLDTADGGTTLKTVVDAAAPGTAPAADQGIDTGGGWLATGAADDATGATGPLALTAATGLLAVGAVLVVRRRRAATGTLVTVRDAQQGPDSR